MEINFKIYIHGRPQGQDVWCTGSYSSDRFYIEPFLDSKIGADADAVMVLDTWEGNTYYTYVRRKNVFEKERAQGYFAITLRISNGYCHNVSYLYSLLELVYNEKCLNHILKKENGAERFMIGRFSEIDNYLREIESLINVNFSQIQDSYVKPIDNRNSTTEQPLQRYSFEEVDSPAFFEAARHAKIVISKDYGTKASILERQIADLRKEKDGLERKLSKASETVEATYKDILDRKDDEIRALTKQRDETERKYNQLKENRANVSGNRALRDNILEIKTPLDNLARLMANLLPDNDGKICESDAPHVKNNTWTWLPRIRLQWINTVMLLLLLCISVTHSCRDNAKHDEHQTIQISSKPLGEPDSVKYAPSDDAEDGDDDNDNDYKIDIDGYIGSGDLKLKKEYKLSLIGPEPIEQSQVIWSICGDNINMTNGSLTITQAGDIKITASYNDISTTRELTAK
ncbi:MAG: hypothetical protein IJY03_02725 [Prevotella sp.]|nr:hypothetical protein [Prevotella sp.]